VTINDLKINVSLLEKGTEANPFKEKDEEISSLRKSKGEFALSTKTEALQKAMIAYMTRRKTSSMKSARGMRL